MEEIGWLLGKGAGIELGRMHFTSVIIFPSLSLN